MSRCDNGALLKKIKAEMLAQNTEIDFRLRKDLPDCRKIDTKGFAAISEAYTYNKFRKPVNRFECNRKGCTTSGTLTMNAADETVTYRAMYDATEFANGVVTFYVKPEGDYPIAVTLKISDRDSFTNADVYTVSLTNAMVTDDGYIPVMINLANTPTSTEGTGWNATDTGAYIQLSADKKAGYSSIALYDSIDDFDLLETVTISCLSSIGGTFDLEVVEAQCQDVKYNDQVNTLSYPLTGTMITPNYMNLFPMLRKGNATTGYDMTTVERTIGTNGRITLADANQDVCGYITVQAADSCNVSEATFTQSSATNAGDMDEGHYTVVKNNDGTTELAFNTALAGTDVIIRYPKKVEIEEMVANADALNSSQLSMTVPYELNDGTRLLYVFDNVFITSFPATITNTEATFAFTVTIGKDDEGNFFRIQKIVN